MAESLEPVTINRRRVAAARECSRVTRVSRSLLQKEIPSRVPVENGGWDTKCRRAANGAPYTESRKLPRLRCFSEPPRRHRLPLTFHGDRFLFVNPAGNCRCPVARELDDC